MISVSAANFDDRQLYCDSLLAQTTCVDEFCAESVQQVDLVKEGFVGRGNLLFELHEKQSYRL